MAKDFRHEQSIGRMRSYYQCPQCAHLFLSPLPSEAELIRHYDGQTVETGNAYQKAYTRRLKHIGRLIQPLFSPHPIDLLEIGPGSIGVTPMLRSGDTYHAVEYNPLNRSALESACASQGLHHVVASNRDELSGDRTYDIIVLISIVEHVSDPKGLLKDYVRRLKPGGHLILGVPNQDLEFLDPGMLSGPVKSNGNHLHSFSEQSATQLISALSLSLVQRHELASASYLKVSRKLRSVGFCNIRNNQALGTIPQIRLAGAFFISALKLGFWKALKRADFEQLLIAKKEE